MFDYLIVGAGFAGSVLAERLATQANKKVLIIDQRNHIAGNAYDYYNKDGILVHKYGPHIFHTNSRDVFDYLSQFTPWRSYEHKVLASVDGQLVPIPINQNTINKLYGLNLCSQEVEEFMNSKAEPLTRIKTSEDVVVSKVGRGSASDAKVPEFIEFIVKDIPEHQVPMRGGLRWLDLQSLKRHEKAFKDASHDQQIALVDAIAYPDKAAPDMKQGVSFFNKMRDLTLTGFYTTEIGGKDVGYVGNRPNQWNGVPDDVLKQYKLEYSEKELKECISFETKA